MLLPRRIRMDTTAARRVWLCTIHRDVHAQPFARLDGAFTRNFTAIEAHRPAHPPRFKKP